MKRQKVNYKPFLARRQEKKSRRRILLTIILGGILLYVLFIWVLPNLIGALSLINRFKTPVSIQPSVSENATLAPPVLNIPFEATNTTTIQIKGYSLPKSKVEIYIDDDLKTTVSSGDNGDFISEDIPLSLGTNNIFGKTVDNNGSKSLPSKTTRVIYNNEKPTLDLKEPQDNQVIKDSKKVTISGSVTPKDSVSVTINDSRVIVNYDGNFSKTIDINDGDNNIVVTAIDTAGNITQQIRKVIYQPDNQ